MKLITLILFTFISLTAQARQVEVDVISSELGVEDYLSNKTLCLTVVRVPSNGKLLGIVEDVYDCFYGRKAKREPSLHLNTHYLKAIGSGKLHDHLQRLDAQLEFFFSEGE